MLHNGNNKSLIGGGGGGGINGAFPELSENVQNVALQLAAQGNEKATKEGKYYEAIELFTNAIERDSTDHRFYLNRSYCYTQLELYQLAFDDAKQATNLNPTSAKCWFRLGQTLCGLKEYNDAERAFKRVLEIDHQCSETKQELVNVRFQALIHMGFDEESSINAAPHYDSIKNAADALLSDTFQRSVDLSLNLGSVGRGTRSPWTLGRSLSLNQSPDSRNNSLTNFGSLTGTGFTRACGVDLGNGSAFDSLTGSCASMINSNSSVRHGLSPYVSVLQQPNDGSAVTSTSLTMPSSSFAGGHNGHSGSLVNGVSVQPTSAPKLITDNSEHRLPFNISDFGVGFRSNAVESSNNLVGIVTGSKCSILNNQHNNHFNMSQSLSDRSNGGFVIGTSRSSVDTVDSETPLSNNSTSNGFHSSCYNPFNQLPDAKLIENIVPNLSAGHVSCLNAVTPLANVKSLSSAPGKVSEAALNQSIDISAAQEALVSERSNQNFSINDVINRTQTEIPRHPTSYSDIVKRAKKPSDCSKVLKSGDSHSTSPSSGTDSKVENGDYLLDQENGCESPSDGEGKEVKLKASNNANSSSLSRRPTNLWGYHGLRVANVSSNCSRTTLQSYFAKYGRVKCVDRINNKTVENNVWVYYDNANSPVEAISHLQGAVIEGVNVNGSQPLRLYFAPTDDQKDLKFSRPKQPADNKGECYYWRTTNCFSREQCPLLHIPANKNIDAQIWMKMNKEPKESNPQTSPTGGQGTK